MTIVFFVFQAVLCGSACMTGISFICIVVHVVYINVNLEYKYGFNNIFHPSFSYIDFPLVINQTLGIMTFYNIHVYDFFF